MHRSAYTKDMAEDDSERRNMYSEQRAVKAVCDFRDALNQSGWEYVDATFATQLFLETDFCMDAAYSADYIERLERGNTLPTISQYRDNPELALDMLRLAMYCQWIPLYRELHSSRDFEVWLPIALDIVAPSDGLHVTERCRNVIVDSERLTRSGLACGVSPMCPARFVAHDVLLSTPFMPLDESECLTRDMYKAQQDADTLLKSVGERGMITPEQMNQALEESRMAYDALIA